MNIEHIKIKEEQKLLSPVQREFNRLNDKIEKIKKNIEKIPIKIDVIRNFHLEKISPIKEQIRQVRFDFIKRLDYMYETTKLSCSKKETLANEILDEADMLISEYSDDPNINLIEEINDKYMKIVYSDEELEEMKNDEKDFMKSVSEKLFGLDMDDFDDVSEDDYQEFFRKKVEEKFQEVNEKWERINEHRQKYSYRSKKTAAQIKKEMLKKAEENATFKTLREIYTDLVKKLHPDREQDEKLKLEKTELMKQITEAYEKKDLATLLIMQIKWLQQTDKDPQNQPDEILARYNKVLKMYIQKLEKEYDELLRGGFPFDTGVDSFRLLNSSEKMMYNMLEREVYLLKKELKNEKQILSIIQSRGGLNKYLNEIQEEEDELNYNYSLLEKVFDKYF